MKKRIITLIGFTILFISVVFFAVALGGLFWTMAQTSDTLNSHSAKMISDRALFAVKLSLISATTSAIIAMLLAIPSGYLLSRREFPFKSIIETLLIMPMVVSPVAMGALLLIFFNTSVGKFIEKILGGVVFEVRGIVVAQVVMISGLAITLVKTIFDFIDKNYEETARTLGCNETETFLKVSLPMASKGLIAAFVLVWSRALGEFGASVTLAGATTYKTETLPIAIYLALASADIYYTGVLVILSVAMAFGIIFVLNKMRAMNKKN